MAGGNDDEANRWARAGGRSIEQLSMELPPILVSDCEIIAEE